MCDFASFFFIWPVSGEEREKIERDKRSEEVISLVVLTVVQVLYLAFLINHIVLNQRFLTNLVNRFPPSRSSSN